MNQEQTNITTGKQIRHLRTQLGMTQEELAGELNVTRQALSNWERDVNEPDLNMLKKICFLFKDIRVIFILGAGSLRTGIDNHLVVEDIKKLTGSENWINTPEEQLNELNYLKQVEDVDWLGISPALTFEAGPEAAGYMLGNNTLLFNSNNESKVTSGTMARLVVNEIVHPKHHKERITLVDE